MANCFLRCIRHPWVLSLPIVYAGCQNKSHQSIYVSLQMIGHWMTFCIHTLSNKVVLKSIYLTRCTLDLIKYVHIAIV